MAVSFYKSPIFLPSLNSIPKLNGPRNCFFTHPILHTNQLIRHTTTLVSAFPSTVSESSTQKIPSFNEVWISGCFILCLFVILASGFYWFLVFFFWLLQLIETLISRVDLSETEAEASLDFLLKDANEALISAFLVLLRAKGETYEEVRALLWGSLGLSFINWHFKIIVSCTTPWN